MCWNFFRFLGIVGNGPDRKFVQCKLCYENKEDVKKKVKLAYTIKKSQGAFSKYHTEEYKAKLESEKVNVGNSTL